MIYDNMINTRILGLYPCIQSKVVENMIDFLKQTVLYAENTGNNNPFFVKMLWDIAGILCVCF